MEEKKISKISLIISILIFLIVPFIAGMFVGDGLFNDWNIYATVGLRILLIPLLVLIFLGVITFILGKIEQHINKKRLLKINKNAKRKRKFLKEGDMFRIFNPGGFIFDKIEKSGIPSESITGYFGAGIMGCALMVVCFREGGFGALKSFLGNALLSIIALVVFLGILKIIKRIFKTNYVVSLLIVCLAHMLILAGVFYYQDVQKGKNAIYVDIKYGNRVDVQDYEIFSTFPSSFLGMAYYNKWKEHLIMKVDDIYYERCEFPSSLRNDFKKANSYGTFFNQHIKGNYNCD